MGCDLLKQKGLNSTERTNGARGCSEHLPYGTTQQLREEGPQDPSTAPMGTPTPLGTHTCHAAACCCSPAVMAAWMWGAKLRAANQAPKTQRGAAGSPPFALWGQGGRSRLCSLGSFSVPTPRGAAAAVPNCHRPPHGDPQRRGSAGTPPPPPPVVAVGLVAALCRRQTTKLPLLGDLCDSRRTSKRCSGGAVLPMGGGGGLGGSGRGRAVGWGHAVVIGGSRCHLGSRCYGEWGSGPAFA